MIEHFDTLADPFEASRPDAARASPTPVEDWTEAKRVPPSSPMVVGSAILAGLGAVLLMVAVRAVSRRRSSRKRRAPAAAARPVAAAGRSLVAELATRVALGAAGVVGAHLANDVVLPALTRRLAAESARSAKPRRATERSRLDD
jgi:hypothetical protein